MYDVIRYKTDLGVEGELVAPSSTSSSQTVTLYVPYETSYVDFTIVLEKSVDPIKARAWSTHKTGSDNRIVIPNDYFNGYYQSGQYGLRFSLDEIDPLVANNITFATHTSPRSDLIASGILLANDTQFTFQLYKSEEIIPVDSTQYVFDPGEIESSQAQSSFAMNSLDADSAVFNKLYVIDSLAVCHLDVQCSISLPDPLVVDNLIVNDTLTSENNILQTVEIASGVANLDSAYIQGGEFLDLKFQTLRGFDPNLPQIGNYYNPQGSFLHVDSGLFKNLNVKNGCITVENGFTGYKYGCDNAAISSYNDPDKKFYYDEKTDLWYIEPDLAGYLKETDQEEVLPKNLPCGVLTYNSELDAHLLDTIATKGRFVKDSAQMQLELAKPPPGYIHLLTTSEKKKFYKAFTHFSHDNNGSNASPADYDKWAYDGASDEYVISTGTTTFNGVLSEYPYQTYDLTVKLSSTETTDDYMGVIIAYVETTDKFTGQIKQNTLSALRRPTTLNDDGTKGDFIIVYNYGQSDEYILQHPDNDARTVGKIASTPANWSVQGETWLRVTKDFTYNNIKEVTVAKVFVQISEWGSSNINYGWEIDLNQTYGNTNLDLKQFIPESKFGYVVDQQAGTISDFTFYDTSIGSSEIFQLYKNRVWTYLDSFGLTDPQLISLYNIQPGDQPGYYKHPNERYQDYYCTNRLLFNTNPAINSIFYIKSDQGVTSPITLLNAAKTSTSYVTLAIRGTGLNEHNALVAAGEDGNETGSYLLIDDAAYYGEESGINQTRGLRLTIINIDGEYNSPEVDVVSSTDYDTYGDPAASDQLAADIDAMTNGQIGVITSWDAWEAEVTQALRDAARSAGLTKIANVSTIQTAPPPGFEEEDIIRTPYAAIFEKNDEGAKAYEVSSGKGDENPAAFISARITGKTFAAMGDHSANALYSYDNEDLAYIDSADKLHVDKGSVIYGGLWADSATIAQDLYVGENLHVAGGTTIGIDLHVARDATIGNDLSVANDASITNNLDVDGDTTVADFAVDSGSTIDMGANRVTNVADPVDPQDAVTKAVVDAHMGAGWIIADGDSNSEVITLGTIVGSTVTVLGTEFEVEAVVSSPRTLTIGLPDDVKITNDLEVGNDATIKNNLTVEGDTLVNKFTVNASNDISMGNNRVKDVDTPTAGTDAVNKDYVDTRKIVIADSNGNTEEVVLEDTITFLGTAKEIEVEVKATDTVQVGLPDDVYITNNLYVSNDESIGNDLIIGNNTHIAGTGHYRVGNPDSNGTHGIKFWDAHLDSGPTTHATITSYLYDSTNIPTAILDGYELTDANGTYIRGVITYPNSSVSDPGWYLVPSSATGDFATIAGWYVSYLGRLPDKGGIEYWYNQIPGTYANAAAMQANWETAADIEIASSGGTGTFHSYGTPASSIGMDFTSDFAHFHVANDDFLLVNNNPVYHKGNLQLMQIGRWIANAGGLENELGAYLTQEQVFNTWYRFSHSSGGSYPANYNETQSWAYDANTGEISSTVNSGTFIGFTSPAYYGTEPLEVAATVYSPGSDDDTIGVIVGFVIENGVEYTLSIVRNTGGITPAKSFALWYNYLQGDARMIWSVTTGGNNGWASAGETRIGFEKNQGTLTIHSSDFGSTTFNPAYDYTIDLNSDPDLKRFAGTVAYGYCAHSQNDAKFKDITEISGAGTIVDISTGTVYNQHDTSPTNRVSITGTIDVNPGLYYNINKLTLLYKDPNGTITQIEDADPFIINDVGGRVANQSIIPQTDGIYDLGSPNSRWRSLYVTGNTLNMGGVAIKADSSYGFGFSFQVLDSALGGDSFGPGYIIDSASMDGKGFMIVGPNAGMFYDYNNDALYFNKEITTPTFNTTGSVNAFGSGNFGGSLTVDSDALIRGNLTVQGTTTYLNTANTQIRDNVILLNGNESGNGVSLGTSGIEIERGTAANKSFLWDETNDRWTIGTETLYGTFVGNVTGQVDDISNFTTTDLTEGTNQYYTVTRANSAIDNRVTKSFIENLNISITESQITDLVHYTSTDFNTDFSTKSTTNLSEGTNLYYTTARHDSDTLVLVDSAYVQARQVDFYRDSAFVIDITDSAYVQARQSYDANRIYIREAGPTDSNADFHIPYIRVTGTSGNTGHYQLGADLDGTGFRYNPYDNELIVQKLRADNTITSRHIIPAADSTYDLGSSSNRFRDLYLSGNTIDLGGVTLKNDGGKFNAGGITLDSNFVVDIVDSTYVQVRQNYDYNSLTNLPFILDSNNVSGIVDSAINELIAGAPEAFNTLKELSDAIADGDSNLTTLISSKVNQSDVITLIDSAYIQARQVDIDTYRDSGFVTNIIDSAYINARVDAVGGGSGTIDSAALELIIDSDYVNARVNTVVGNTIITSYKFIADSGQSIFTGSDANGNSLYYTDNVIVFLNGINLTQGDYTLTNNETITMVEGLDSGAELTIHKFAFSYTGTPSNPIDQFRFVADSAQTVFTDSDYNGNVLSYNPNGVTVYINGILVSKTADWTTDNDGTTITLVDAANINDEIVVINHNNISTDLDDLYVPSNTGHWNTTPTTVGEALDMLAAAFNAQHGAV